VFGLKSDVKDNIWFSEENILVYPAGHHTIVLNKDTRAQTFIPATEGGAGITAMCVSPSKRYIAIAERGQRGMVSVYDMQSLKKRKVLTTTESASREYISVSFSSNKLLLTLGGGPDWTLVLWQWEKSKTLSSLKVSNANMSPLNQCSFNPVDPSVCCVSGDSIFKAFRIVNNILKPMPNLLGQMEPRNFTSHLWLNDDRIVLGTSQGELLLFEGGEFITVLACSPNDSCSINCMANLSNGFIAGSSAGNIRVFMNTDSDHGYFRLAKETCVNEVSSNRNIIANSGLLGTTIQDEDVLSIAVSPSEESAVVSLKSQQLILLTLQNNNVLKQSSIETMLLCDSFHRPGETQGAVITGMDVCVRKPLLVTCGLDKTVRLWNYLENQSDLVKIFSEEAHSVSFHPSGLHLVVGFTDKLRFLNVLMDDLRTAKEIPIKACRECQFSTGGHLFAAVNGNTIQIFDTYSCECKVTMRGHNGKVKSLFWSQNDSQLISCGMDGAVYQWDLKDFKRDGEYVKKGCNYSAALSNKSGEAIFAVGSDMMLREVEFPVSVVTKEIECHTVISQLVMSASQRMLFGGTGDEGSPGYVRSFKFPITGDFTEYPCASAPITRMRMSWEDQFLFVASEDGCVQIFEVRDKDKSDASTVIQSWAEEILVTKSDLEEKNALMTELKSKVDELTLHNEYQLRLKDMSHNEKIKEATEKFTQELEQDKNRYELLREEKNDMEMEYTEKLKKVHELHALKLTKIESRYQGKIMGEVERFQQLCHERDVQVANWEKQRAKLLESHQQYVEDVSLDYEAQLSDDQEVKAQVEDEVDELNKEFQETMRQLEGDIDKEIELLKSKFEIKLNKEREATLRFKGENGIMKKKFAALQKDIEVQKEDINIFLTKEEHLVTQINGLEKEIQNLRSEIRDRDETIGGKEKHIYELKKKNQELEKFKFVLDYKIKELKRQIEPRENEIMDMKEQIKEMDRELEQYHKSNTELDTMIGNLRSKLDSMQKSILQNRHKLSEFSTRMDRFTGMLYECVQHIQNPDDLKSHVKALYEQNITESLVVVNHNSDIQQEYHRQKDYLEKSVVALKRRLETDVRTHKSENMTLMQSNMNLIKEINDLREQVRINKMKNIMEESAKSTAPAKPNLPKSNVGQHRLKRISNEPKPVSSIIGYSSDEIAIIEDQKVEIGRLKAVLHGLEDKMMADRPVSRERLDPL